jgi:hypothetical protein
LIWTIGFAIGGSMGGLPDSASGQQLLLVLVGLCNLLFALFILYNILRGKGNGLVLEDDHSAAAMQTLALHEAPGASPLR